MDCPDSTLRLDVRDHVDFPGDRRIIDYILAHVGDATEGNFNLRVVASSEPVGIYLLDGQRVALEHARDAIANLNRERELVKSDKKPLAAEDVQQIAF